MKNSTAHTENTNADGNLSRRQFRQACGAAAAGIAIVPRHVLGGQGFVAPSEKVTLACIGFGTQAVREIGGILASPDVQVVAMCAVEKDGENSLEWEKGEVRNVVRELLQEPGWREGNNNPPGGREVGKEIVETS